jgi:hypothetical protein
VELGGPFFHLLYKNHQFLRLLHFLFLLSLATAVFFVEAFTHTHTHTHTHAHSHPSTTTSQKPLKKKEKAAPLRKVNDEQLAHLAHPPSESLPHTDLTKCEVQVHVSAM